MIVTFSGGPRDKETIERPTRPVAIDIGDPNSWYSPVDNTNTYAWSLKPTTIVDDPSFQEALPVAVKDHLQHLRDYRVADPATITNAQTVHVVKDLISIVYYLNNRLEKE